MFWTYFKSIKFWKDIVLSIAVSFLIVFLLSFFLRFYTRHSNYLKVPLLKNAMIDVAITKLEDQGLHYQIDSLYILDQTPGLVIEQEPAPLSDVKQERKIYLTVVSRLTPKIAFPNVENLDIEEAKALLENNELRIKDTIFAQYIAKNIVLDVKIGELILNTGDLVPKGAYLTVVLGDGNRSNNVFVPQLVGLSLKDAVKKIKRSSLRLGAVKFRGKGDSLRAKIVLQRPLADSLKKVYIGTRVNLTIDN